MVCWGLRLQKIGTVELFCSSVWVPNCSRSAHGNLINSWTPRVYVVNINVNICRYHPRHPGRTFFYHFGIPVDFRYLKSTTAETHWDFMEAANSYAVENEGFMACNPFQAGLGDDMEAGIDAGYIYDYVYIYDYIYNVYSYIYIQQGCVNVDDSGFPTSPTCVWAYNMKTSHRVAIHVQFFQGSSCVQFSKNQVGFSRIFCDIHCTLAWSPGLDRSSCLEL